MVIKIRSEIKSMFKSYVRYPPPTYTPKVAELVKQV